MKKYLVLLTLIHSIFNLIHAQVGINMDGSKPDSSAMLDVKSYNKGLLVPRMISYDKDNIPLPAEGLLIYQIETPQGFYYFDGDEWQQIANIAQSVDVDFYRANSSFCLPKDIHDDIYTYGNIGINEMSPQYTLDIKNVDCSKAINISFSGNSTSSLYGIQNYQNNSSYGSQYGFDNTISGNGSGNNFGINQTLSGSGNGDHYGIRQVLSGTGTGFQTAIKNEVSNSADGYQFGTMNDLTGDGDGIHAGTSNFLIGEGEGAQYGIHNELRGSGNGDKYGSHNLILSTAGGTHYAVYAQAEKIGSYAGYFVGEVKVTKSIEVIQKINAPTSGDADMKAYVYGFISSWGTISTDRSSDGFSINKTGTGVYKITLSGVSGDDYIVSATTEYNGTPILTNVDYLSSTGNEFNVLMFNLSGNPVDRAFHFVVYKK